MLTRSKLRILYIGILPPEFGGKKRGGVATYAGELATQAIKHGYEVYFLADTVDGNSKTQLNLLEWPKYHKLKKVLLGFETLLRHKESLSHFRKFMGIRNVLAVYYKFRVLQPIIQSVKPDLIHVLYLQDPVVFSISILEDHPPMIVTDHGIGVVFERGLEKEYGVDVDNAKGLQLVIEAINSSQHVVCVSDFARSALLRTFENSIKDPSKISAILNPIDINKYTLLDKESIKWDLELEGKHIILFIAVSQPFKIKKLDLLLEAMAVDEWLSHNCKLIIITTIEAGQIAEKYIKSTGIDAVILPPLPQTQLYPYYNAADVFVVPSRKESIGLVYAEALISGTPVVGYYQSIEELRKELGVYIGEGFNSMHEGSQELAEKIKKVLMTKIEQQELHKAVIDKLSWEVKFREYDQLYKKVINTYNH